MAYMSHVVTLPFPVETLANVITGLAFNQDGDDFIYQHPIDGVVAWAMSVQQAVEQSPEPVLYDQDSPRHAGAWDPEIEQLLREEEEIERSVRAHHEIPHFRPGDDD